MFVFIYKTNILSYTSCGRKYSFLSVNITVSKGAKIKNVLEISELTIYCEC